MFANALNGNLNHLQRYKVFYYLRQLHSILSRLGRRFQYLTSAGPSQSFQLMTILEEARHTLIIIEHGPLLYEDAQRMVEYVSQGLHDASKEATVFTHQERYVPGGSDQKCRQGILLRRRTESYDEFLLEGLSNGAEEPDNPGGLDLIRRDLWRLMGSCGELQRLVETCKKTGGELEW